MTLIEQIDASIEHEANELGIVWLEMLRISIRDALDGVTFNTPARSQTVPHVDAILSIMRPAAIEKARKELQQRAIRRMLEDQP